MAGDWCLAVAGDFSLLSVGRGQWPVGGGRSVTRWPVGGRLAGSEKSLLRERRAERCQCTLE